LVGSFTVNFIPCSQTVGNKMLWLPSKLFKLVPPERLSAVAHRSMSRRILKNLLISISCILLILVLLFFPFLYYSSFQSPFNSSFTVGIYFNYNSYPPGQITTEVAHIQSVGFKLIRITLLCDPKNNASSLNNQTNEVLTAASQYGIKVALVTSNHEVPSTLQYYLTRWGQYLSYIQILNEPELSTSWAAGAVFTDDEILTNFQMLLAVVQQQNLSAQLYTNFEPGYTLRSNIPIQLSKNLDFVGFDVYMQSVLVMSPHLVQGLHMITQKSVTITEFGMSTSNDIAQASFLIQGLNLFKNMGLNGCWLVYWNSTETFYGIRGRLAEQKIGEWIAQNT
jgi:hypothetical protein